jgi:hypothetical protein
MTNMTIAAAKRARTRARAVVIGAARRGCRWSSDRPSSARDEQDFLDERA